MLQHFNCSLVCKTAFLQVLYKYGSLFTEQMTMKPYFWAGFV
jgi:hypothetical protein